MPAAAWARFLAIFFALAASFAAWARFWPSWAEHALETMLPDLPEPCDKIVASSGHSSFCTRAFPSLATAVLGATSALVPDLAAAAAFAASIFSVELLARMKLELGNTEAACS